MKRSGLLLMVSMYFVAAFAAVFLPSFDVSNSNGNISIQPQAAYAQSQQEQTEANTACSPLIPGASNSAVLLSACTSGYISGKSGKTKDASCSTWSSGSINRQYCEKGWEAGNNASQPNNNAQGGNQDEGCGTSFDWIVCKIIRGVADTVEFVEDRFIQPFLDFRPLSTSVDSNPMYKVWQVMRNLANALFIIIFLVFIFANTLSINLDAYTVKKMLPKLVAAAILVQLSYLLATLAIDITNIFGRGLFILGNDIIPPYSSPDGNAEVRGGLLGLTGLAVAASALAYGAVTGSIFVVMIGAFFGIMATFLTLIFRQIVITVLIIAAPIAFALWVLPNTENIFRKWLDMFIKVLAMYPLIVLLFLAGKLFATAAGAAGGTFAPVFALVGVTAPLFLLPLTFKFAGGVISQIASFNLKRAGGLQKKLTESQAMKDWKEQRKESAFIRAASPVPSFGRTRARAITGNLFPSRGAQRRLAKGYDKAMSERVEAHDAEFTTKQTAPNILEQLASGVSVPGYERSETMQIAAIRRLAKQKGFNQMAETRKSLRNIAARIPAQKENIDRIWSTAIQPDYGDIAKAAPDMVGPLSKPLVEDFAPFEKITPAALAETHSSTMGRLLEKMNTDPTVRVKMAPHILRSVEQISKSGSLKNKMSPEAIAMLHKNAATAFAGQSHTFIDANGVQQTQAAQQWLQDQINLNASPTPGQPPNTGSFK